MKKAIIDFKNVMPDNVYPAQRLICEPRYVDMVFIYYRNDGYLYLFDVADNKEFNLYNLHRRGIDRCPNIKYFGVLSEYGDIETFTTRYSLYYKEDSILYMYDMILGIEYNLFNLSNTFSGSLIVTLNKYNVGSLNVSLNKIDLGSLIVNLNKYDVGSLTVNLQQFSPLTVTLNKYDVGSLTVTLNDVTTMDTYARVYNSYSNTPIEGATVTLIGSDLQEHIAVTQANGIAYFSVPQDTYQVNVAAAGFEYDYAATNAQTSPNAISDTNDLNDDISVLPLQGFDVLTGIESVRVKFKPLDVFLNLNVRSYNPLNQTIVFYLESDYPVNENIHLNIPIDIYHPDMNYVYGAVLTFDMSAGNSVSDVDKTFTSPLIMTDDVIYAYVSSLSAASSQSYKVKVGSDNGTGLYTDYETLTNSGLKIGELQ